MLIAVLIVRGTAAATLGFVTLSKAVNKIY